MTKIRHKNKVDVCLNCNKEFSHYSWDKQKYCSKECAYTISKVRTNCIVCGKLVLKSKSNSDRNSNNYCSRECYNLRNVAIKRLKRTTTYWRELLDNLSCSCGETKNYLLQIHHMDGIHTNNDKSNLEIVCSNCHVKRHLKKDSSGNWVYHPKTLTDRSLLSSL